MSFYYLNGLIEEEQVTKTINFILENQDKQSLDLYLTSDGGSCQQAFALVAIIEQSKVPLTIHGIGKVSSGGLTVFMSGHRRLIYKNTQICCHQVYSCFSGIENQILNAELVRHKQIIDMTYNHYKKYTKASHEELKTKLLTHHDIWLTPEEAIKYGFADEIV